ncbi:hypothetical protein, partial [Burkholderia contaminans]|uniref:hypothetical protein n=1 Tax=Burkholderia contaminans TaxID=488447 RepID=UPI001C89B375
MASFEKAGSPLWVENAYSLNLTADVQYRSSAERPQGSVKSTYRGQHVNACNRWALAAQRVGTSDLSPLKYPTVKLVARPQEKPCHEEI